MRRGNRPNASRLGVTIAAGLLALGAVLVVELSVQGQSSDQAVAAVPRGAPSDAAPGDLTARDISIAAQTGTKLTLATPAQLLPGSEAAQRSKAIELAGNSLTMLRGHATRAASLMNVTIEGYGTPAAGGDEDADPGQLKLLIQNRVLWVVQIADVDVPILGRGKDADGTLPAATDRSDMLVFVDPVTMKILRVESIAEDVPESPGRQQR